MASYTLLVHPVVLGSGRGVFSDVVVPTRFKVLNQTAFKTGIVALELQPA
jgi:hypothetical protein